MGMSLTKTCRLCGETKPIEEFYKAPGCVDGRRGECRTCFQSSAVARKEANPELKEIARQRTAKWIEDNQDRYREYKRSYRQTDSFEKSFRKWHLKKNYGLTPEQYDEMLERQGGGCAICGKPPGDIALHVDHCHDTGRVRGLLCFSCNAGLGQFRHDPQLLGRAMDYAAIHWRIEDLKADGPGRGGAATKGIASGP